MRIARYSGLSSLLLLVLVLTACGGLTNSDKPATRTWWLEPYDAGTQEQGPVSRVSVSVGVIPGLDTDRILTLSENARLSNYTGARWADNLPELLTSLIGRTLGASGRFDVVSNHAGGGHEDCELQLEVQEFFARTGLSGPGAEVTITIEGRYSCSSGTSTPIHLAASNPVHEDRMSAIVAAFQSGTDRVMKDLLKQIL